MKISLQDSKTQLQEYFYKKQNREMENTLTFDNDTLFIVSSKFTERQYESFQKILDSKPTGWFGEKEPTVMHIPLELVTLHALKSIDDAISSAPKHLKIVGVFLVSCWQPHKPDFRTGIKFDMDSSIANGNLICITRANQPVVQGYYPASIDRVSIVSNDEHNNTMIALGLNCLAKWLQGSSHTESKDVSKYIDEVRECTRRF